MISNLLNNLYPDGKARTSQDVADIISASQFQFVQERIQRDVNMQLQCIDSCFHADSKKFEGSAGGILLQHKLTTERWMFCFLKTELAGQIVQVYS